MNNFLKFFLVPLILFLFFFNLYKSRGYDYSSSLFSDEYSWIARGYFFELLIKRDFDNPLWNTYGEGFEKGVDGDPKLASYVYGLSLYPSYLRDKKERREEYDMVKFFINNNFFSGFMNQTVTAKYEGYIKASSEYISWNPRELENPTLSDLIAIFGNSFDKTVKLILKARVANYFATALSIVVGYFIAKLVLKKFWVSFLASFFYGSSTLVLTTGTYAGTEGLFLFLFNLGLLLLIIIFSRQKFSWPYLMAFALTIALLNQTKLNGVMLIFIFNLFAFFKITQAFLSKKKDKSVVKTIVVNLVFLTAYIALNPFLYKNTVRNIAFQYKWTYGLAQDQQTRFSGQALLNPTERAGFFLKSFFGEDSAILPYFIKGQPALGELIRYLALFLFILGVSRLFLKALQESKKFFERKSFYFSSESILFLSYLAMLIILSAYLLIGWDRYLVHLILPVWLVTIYGLMVSFRIVAHLAKTK